MILCSPTTLFSLLVAIREAFNNFSPQSAANGIISLMGAFYKQWEKFKDAFDDERDKKEKLEKSFDNMSATRRRALDRR